MATLQIVPTPAAVRKASLFELEESLAAFLDSADTITPDQEEEYLQDLGVAIVAAVDKRQRFHEFLTHLESQAAMATTEIQRLQARKASIEATHDRLEQYVVGVIEKLGPDAKGKLRKLEGHTVTLSARGVAAKVEILDEALLPASCRRVSLKLPADLWEHILDCVDLDLRCQILDAGTTPQQEPSKSTTMKALESAIGKDVIEREKQAGSLSIASAEVPGAQLLINRHTLVRR